MDASSDVGKALGGSRSFAKTLLGVPSSREYARRSPSTKFDAGHGGHVLAAIPMPHVPIPGESSFPSPGTFLPRSERQWPAARHRSTANTCLPR